MSVRQSTLCRGRASCTFIASLSRTCRYLNPETCSGG